MSIRLQNSIQQHSYEPIGFRLKLHHVQMPPLSGVLSTQNFCERLLQVEMGSGWVRLVGACGRHGRGKNEWNLMNIYIADYERF